MDKKQQKIDVNSISEKELVKILSISPRVARRIRAIRPYKNLQQLDQVWGIDDETRQKILDQFEIHKYDITDSMRTNEVNEENKKDIEIFRVPKKESISSQTTGKSKSSWMTSLLLLLIFVFGAYFRFTGINWDENKHQHPDERYLTMVAEKIQSVKSFEEYFDTANSTMNPVGRGSYTYGMLPLFATRLVAEWVDMTNYDSINLVGRFLSGFFDLASILALYLLAKRLYGRKVAILTAALSVAAVLPIQLSHFFAVDSFATFFVVTSFYFLLLAVPFDQENQEITESNYVYFGIFGFLVGMAGACKVNTLPALGMVIFGGILYLFLIRKQPRFWKSFWTVFLGLFLAGLFAFVAFRIFQPYAFNGPRFSDLSINESWLKVIKEVTNQVAGNSEWPPNHHWTSRPIQYAWENIVLWGLGLPLGLMAWFGWGWAGYRIWKGDWRRHLFPFVWVFVYFVWQNMQFWRYMRYFIPIYPFLILFASWALIEIFRKSSFDFSSLKTKTKKSILQDLNFRDNWKSILSILLFLIVIIGTYSYAFAFTRIYTRTHTRVEASRWMLANIPGPLNVVVDSEGDTSSYPIKVFNNRIVEKGAPLISDFETRSDGSVSKIFAPQIKYIGGYLHFWISKDEEGNDKLSDIRWVIPDNENQDTLLIKSGDFDLVAGIDYYFHYRFRNNNQITFESIILKKDNLDDVVIPIDLSFENQIPGIYSGKIKFNHDQNIQINQIIIQNFQQQYLSSTAKMRMSILKEGDENNPLAVTEKSIEFLNPGERFSEEFKFSQIYLDKATKYLVKFELLEGNAIQLLAENFTLETSWDDSLPLNVDKVNVGGIYSPFNLELYQPDTPEKRDRMIEILDKSKYIVVPSNRGYDAMPRLVTRYPLTLKYYQLLFDCNCSGDEMEKRAYGLEPPFISPLGFELSAIFVSHPNLGLIQINDQNADESFTVYDHPKVFIFKKTDSFSLDKVKQELFAVDLDEVIFQKPIDVSRVENGLKLPDDRLSVQTSGGTWSDIFNRDSLINQNPVITVVAWYFFIFIIGWIVLPLTVHLFQGIPDKGYSLIRIVSLLLLTWFTWLSGSLKVLSFSKGTILFWILLLAVINIVWFYRRKHQILEYIRLNWRYIIFVEVIFLILFIFSLQIRIANPDLWHPWFGGEKPMEFAFFNSVNKAVFFPPQNPWFSEHYINYYYYGYIIAAIPTKLLGILPSIAFNLILPTWFGMTGLGVFGIGYNLYLGFKKKENLTEINVEYNRQLERRAFFNFQSLHLPAYFAGIFTLIFILFLGNFYQVKLLWDYLPDVSTVVQDVDSDNKLISVISGAQNVLSGDAELPGGSGRWYFSASRPILHDGPDTPIAEFPYFSFLYGDLHPHLLSMPFYALGFAWCLSLLLTPLHHKRRYQQIFLMIMAGLIFGFFRVTHTWDFPIFIGLGILSITWMFIKDKKLGFEQQVKKSILYVLFFIVLSVILYLPFTYWFKTAYNSIEIWKGAKTPLFDYFIVFGMAIFIMFGFLMDELKSNISKIVNNWQRLNIGKLVIPLLILIIMVLGTLILWKTNYQVLAFAWPLLITWVWIIFFKNEVRDLRKLIWLLFAIGFSITFIVEVIVLKGDVGRSNMVFRMYNIAWFILGIAMSTALIEIRNNLKRYPKFIEICWLLIFLILLILGLTYQSTATNKKMNDRWPNVESPPRTLDGSLFMLGNPNSSGGYTPALYKENEIDLDLSLDYDAIQFIQDTIIGSPVIVEGHTAIYRWGARYSIYTGLPSVIGWEWHTIQHNSLLDRAVVDKRIERIKEFYNTTDLTTAKDFINRFSVKYIVISGLERAIYSAEGLDKFNTMVENGELSIIYGESKTDTAIIYEVSMK